MHNNQQRYNRKGIVYFEDVIKYIPQDQKVIFCGEEINLKSDRLKLFSNSQTCVACQLTAEFFAVERDIKETGKYHLNMYGICDGEEVLFTKDHIIPKSKGGPDNMSNYQVMCYPCNYNKGNTYSPGEE